VLAGINSCQDYLQLCLNSATDPAKIAEIFQKQVLQRISLCFVPFDGTLRGQAFESRCLPKRTRFKAIYP
jgi:hypothetical protein